MTVDYKCEKCGEVIEYNKEYKVDFPQTIECPKCREVCKRVWSSENTGAIIIPHHMSATRS